jgi:hypothetical protein
LVPGGVGPGWRREYIAYAKHCLKHATSMTHGHHFWCAPLPLWRGPPSIISCFWCAHAPHPGQSCFHAAAFDTSPPAALALVLVCVMAMSWLRFRERASRVFGFARCMKLHVSAGRACAMCARSECRGMLVLMLVFSLNHCGEKTLTPVVRLQVWRQLLNLWKDHMGVNVADWMSSQRTVVLEKSRARGCSRQLKNPKESGARVQAVKDGWRLASGTRERSAQHA